MPNRYSCCLPSINWKIRTAVLTWVRNVFTANVYCVYCHILSSIYHQFIAHQPCVLSPSKIMTHLREYSFLFTGQYTYGQQCVSNSQLAKSTKLVVHKFFTNLLHHYILSLLLGDHILIIPSLLPLLFLKD